MTPAATIEALATRFVESGDPRAGLVLSDALIEFGADKWPTRLDAIIFRAPAINDEEWSEWERRPKPESKVVNGKDELGTLMEQTCGDKNCPRPVFAIDDVAEVIRFRLEEGSCAEHDAAAIVTLKDGRFATFSVWSDTTGHG